MTARRWTSVLALAVLLVLAQPVRAVEPTGELSVTATLLPSTESIDQRFDSPLNPGNLMGLAELSFAPSIRLELLASSGDSDMEFVTRVSEPSGLEILRANARLFMGDRSSLRAGRFSAATGYGYGWTPTDFWSPQPDPMNPSEEVRGIDGIELSLAPVNALDITLLGIYRRNPGVTGGALADLEAGGEMTLYLSGFEARLTGLYEYDETAGEDSSEPAVGLSAKLDLLGVGIYGEASLLAGGRVPVPDAALTFARPAAPVVNALAGIEYHLPTGIALIAEYFFNGEGYDLVARERYRDALVGAGVPDPALVGIFAPGSFARHYILASAEGSLFNGDGSLEAGVLYSPDSYALSALASASYYFTDAYTVAASYSGLFSLRSGYVNEAVLSPVHHIVTVEGRYLF
jgi:hypothetical protein